jgi:hypothetical protein
MLAGTKQARKLKVRFSDEGARQWFWRNAPPRWGKRVELVFREVPFRKLEIAGSLRHHDVIESWQERLARGQAIPALVVSATPYGTYYLHDGNHRYFALREHFGARVWDLPVRVAVLTPTAGYQWHFQWFGSYATWVLRPAKAWPEDYARQWNPKVVYVLESAPRFG